MSFPLLTMAIDGAESAAIARQRARQLAALLQIDPIERLRLAATVGDMARDAARRGGESCLRIGIDGAGPSQAIDISVHTDRGEDPAARLVRPLPPGATPLSEATMMELSARLAAVLPASDPRDETDALSRDLAQALDALDTQRDELDRINEEIQDTNRGVVALYAELDERAAHLRRADETKSKFLSNMSHEFRTPLNSILALSRLLLDGLDGPLTVQQVTPVTLIRKAAQDLADLVNDLLDLAKVEAGKTVVRAAPFEVTNLFGALRGMLRPLLVADAVTLVFDDPAGMPTLHTDEAKVSQILRNFISNALKFTERGTVRVTASANPADGEVTFSVEDTGLGIAADDQERIFQEFTQLDHPVQARVRGTGLGLPLSRKLAELLGGRLTLRSAPGLGSTFSVTLPAIYGTLGATATAAGHVPGAANPTASLGVPERIALVIDDEPAARYVVRRHLGAGWTILEAADGEEGLRLATRRAPAAIFMDLVMRGLSGLDVLAALRAEPAARAIPVVIITSKTLSSAEQSELASLGGAILGKHRLTEPDAGSLLLQSLAAAEAGILAPATTTLAPIASSDATARSRPVAAEDDLS